MKLEDLFESPQMTFPTNFGLENESENAKLAREYLRDYKKIELQKFGNGTHILYEFPNAYILMDHTDPLAPLIAYIMQYKLNFFEVFNTQAAQQVVVHVDKLNHAAIGIARTIFFDHLLKKYHVIITDTQQTPDGQRFWGHRIAEAFVKNMNVYYVNLETNEILKINDIPQFRSVAKDKEIWGLTEKHQLRRIVISEKELNLP